VRLAISARDTLEAGARAYLNAIKKH